MTGLLQTALYHLVVTPADRSPPTSTGLITKATGGIPNGMSDPYPSNGGWYGRSSLSTVREAELAGECSMSGRHGRSTREDQADPQDPQAAVEAEADRIATAIAGLLWRLLQNPEFLEHQKVLGELRKLEEGVAEYLAYSDGNQGRHRSAASGVINQDISDTAGHDLKPDPLTATTPAAFIEVLRQYRAWSGDPSWRQMADRAGQAVVFSTMYNAMNGEALPKLHVVKAIINGCGGGQDDLNSFIGAWRRIKINNVRDKTWRRRSPDE